MVKAEEMPKGQVIDAWTAVATQLEWVAEDTGLVGGGERIKTPHSLRSISATGVIDGEISRAGKMGAALKQNQY